MSDVPGSRARGQAGAWPLGQARYAGMRESVSEQLDCRCRQLWEGLADKAVRITSDRWL